MHNVVFSSLDWSVVVLVVVVNLPSPQTTAIITRHYSICAMETPRCDIISKTPTKEKETISI